MRRAYSRNKNFRAPTRNRLIYSFLDSKKDQQDMIHFQNSSGIQTRKQQENLLSEGQPVTTNQQQIFANSFQDLVFESHLASNKMDLQPVCPIKQQHNLQQQTTNQQVFSAKQTSQNNFRSQSKKMDIQQCQQQMKKQIQQNYDKFGTQIAKLQQSYDSFNSDNALDRIQQLQKHERNMNNSYMSFDSDEALDMIGRQIDFQKALDKSYCSFDSDQASENLAKYMTMEELEDFHKIN